jgi:predicted metal-binding membrane protein
MLWRYRKAVGRTGETRLGRLTALAGAGYFLIWALFGMGIFPLGVALATVEMHEPALARATPMTVGLVLLIAGAIQFTGWKAHHLTQCRKAPCPACMLPGDVRTALRQGVRFGFHCGLSCANLTVVLLVIGVMDLPAMVGVTAAITAERLAPAGERIARGIGAVVGGAGLLLIARAARLG